jgi:molybdopterin/thiamine biosynthesis adenylyltransferase
MKTDTRAQYIGDKNDQALLGKTVSLAGLGSVGSFLSEILCREQIGLRLVDKGRVDEDDMHRLGLFYEEDITRFKVKQAKSRLAAIIPGVPVKSFHEELGDGNVFLLKGDVIVDATNSNDLNELIMKQAISQKAPGVIVRYSGTTAKVLVYTKKPTKKAIASVSLPSVEEVGMVGSLSATVAGVVASQVQALLLGEKRNFVLTVDVAKNSIRTTKL